MIVEVIVDRLGLPGSRHRADTSAMRPSASAGVQDDAERLSASFRSGGNSGSIEMQPETWKPPTATVTPVGAKLAARYRARADTGSIARRQARPCRRRPRGYASRRLRDIDDRVALVASLDLDIDVGTEHALIRAFLEQAIDAGEAVRGDRRAQPLDDIAVVVVMRRLDQNDAERALGRASVQCSPLPNRETPHTPAIERQAGGQVSTKSAQVGAMCVFGGRFATVFGPTVGCGSQSASSAACPARSSPGLTRWSLRQ